MPRHPGKSSRAKKAKKDHKKLDNRFKNGIRKNNKMPIKSGPNGPKKKKGKK